jgi:WD40 repeat protein
MAPLQFIIRGKPSSFDLSSSNDIMAVSSPGCITLFNINGFGSPKYVIHYEQPQQVRQLKFQRSNHLILAALRGPGLSLWDPNNPIRPLKGLISSAGWITDVDWSWGAPSLLATSCDRGEIRIFDTRSSYEPVLKFLQSDSVIRGTEWSPSNTSLLTAVCNDKSIVAWDTRAASESEAKKYKTIQFDNSILQAHWGHESSMAVGTSNGAVEWWDIHADYSLNGNDIAVNRESILRPPIVEQSSVILPTSTGKGIVVSRLISDDVIDIRLHGYTRDGQDLGRVFLDPATDAFSDAPSLSLGQSCDSIIGMRWGTPGRLCPPAHAGMELLVFTESCMLHPIKLSPDVVYKYCGGSSTILSHDPVKARNLSIRRTQLAPDVNNGHRYLPKYFLEDVKTRTANKLSIGSSEENPASIISYERAGSPSMTMDSIYANKSLSEVFWNQLKEDFVYLQNLSDAALLTHLTCQFDEGSRQLTLGISRQLTSGIISRTAFSESVDANQDVSLTVSFPSTISPESLPMYSIQPYPTDTQVRLRIK